MVQPPLLEYEPPVVTSYTDDEVLDALGPVATTVSVGRPPAVSVW